MTTRAVFPLVLLFGCSTAGSAWIAEPLTAEEAPLLSPKDTPPPRAAPPPGRRATRTIAIGKRTHPPQANTSERAGGTVALDGGGRSLGTFRNTYYDFPSEADFSGPPTTLYDGECKAIASVPKEFYEAVCVQGSGTLRRGKTVSFARRDCACAAVCPRTDQKICFDELDAQKFPWGRGATGKAITPLVTVAVDSEVIPLGTPLFVPELAGLPRDEAARAAHDGCFVAQDRGLRVKGKHIDVFTGHRSITKLWNQRVPSNQGVTVVVDSPRCARAKVPPL
jgi:3D (Asp-Asp-Asp) domain-containing protein